MPVPNQVQQAGNKVLEDLAVVASTSVKSKQDYDQYRQMRAQETGEFVKGFFADNVNRMSAELPSIKDEDEIHDQWGSMYAIGNSLSKIDKPKESLLNPVLEEPEEQVYNNNGKEISHDELKAGLYQMETSSGSNVKPRYEPAYHEKLKTKFAESKWTPTKAERRYIGEVGEEKALKEFSTSYGKYQIIPETAYRYTSFAGDPQDLKDDEISEGVADELIDYFKEKSGGDFKKMIYMWNQGGEYLPKLEKILENAE